MKNKEKGITLISLVVTVIVLIILAGVSISLVFNQNGIINRAKQAKELSLEQNAIEKLELELKNLLIEKATTTNYNDEFFNTYLTERGFVVNDNIVLVDGWQFQVDKSVPKIVESLGKGEEIQQITVTTDVTYAADYTKAILKVGITYEGNIEQIKINGEETEIPIKTDNKYELEKEILTNGNCSIYIKDESSGYKLTSASVTEVSEDMKISTVEELVAFRDRVNRGATYNGKTVELTQDLNLSSVCYKVDETTANYISWEPIGNYGTDTTHYFSGIFNGNNHTIDYLYINNTNDYQGLFGYVQNGTITGIVIGTNSTIKANSNVGGIAGKIDNSTVSNCGNNAEIVTINGYTGGIIGYCNNSECISTYNKGNITSNGELVGGIVGTMNATTSKTIKYSYNIGNVTGGIFVGGIVGYGGDYTKVYNCYNKGSIKTTNIRDNSSFLGGISGRLRAYGLITYSYNLGSVTNENTGRLVGGIVGSNEAFNGSKHIATRASTVSYSYNSGNVTSKGTLIGGITGINQQYCYIKNCYISNTATVKYNTTSATANIGSSSNYLGKFIGQAYSKNSTYVNNVGVLETMPTVYNVVNGLSDEKSSYWSNTNLNEPKLLWEKQKSN